MPGGGAERGRCLIEPYTVVGPNNMPRYIEKVDEISALFLSLVDVRKKIKNRICCAEKQPSRDFRHLNVSSERPLRVHLLILVKHHSLSAFKTVKSKIVAHSVNKQQLMLTQSAKMAA